jgi:tryptophanyl-tRNA synthetase
VTFYRQSDIPEIPELTWLLTCVTGKGLLNRAHAYKAAVDKNRGRRDPDDVTAGLFMYPVLMGADILMFNAHKVPVGATRSSTSRWRATWRQLQPPVRRALRAARGRDRRNVATLPGLDGRKMSKSYDNTIPLFARASSCEAHRRHRHRLARARRAQGHRRLGPVPDLPGLCHARGDRRHAPGLCRRHRLGRGQAAAVRAHRPRDRPMRARYDDLMAHPEKVEAILQAGASARAWPALAARTAPAVGLRSLAPAPQARRQGRQGALPASSSTARPTASSTSSSSPRRPPAAAKHGLRRAKEAGQAIARLQKEADALQALAAQRHRWPAWMPPR